MRCMEVYANVEFSYLFLNCPVTLEPKPNYVILLSLTTKFSSFITFPLSNTRARINLFYDVNQITSLSNMVFYGNKENFIIY